MSDDQRGSPLGGAEDRALDLILRGTVDGTGCIIKYQDTGVREERPRKCDALPLTAGEGHPTFADHRLVTFVEAHDKVMCLGGTCSGLDFPLSCIRTAEGDIL